MRTTWRLSALTVSMAMILGGGPAAFAQTDPGQRDEVQPASSVHVAGIAVAQRLLALQDRNGAIADTPGGGTVNEDSDLAYALWGLAAAYRATHQRRYLRGLRKGVRWLADRVVMQPGRWRGSYWYAYRSRPPYAPRRTSPGGDVADVRGVDASSALFVYDLWLYTRLSGERRLARLYDTARHRRAARFLDRATTSGFFLPGPRRFALGREDGRTDAAMEGFNGVFPQGYLPWVFPDDQHTADALAWLAGCSDAADALRCAPNGVAHSLAAAVLALGSRATGPATADPALGWVLATTYHPATGAVGDSDRHPDDEYSNVDGFTALALLGAPPDPFGW